jgi:hypothetical protein
MGRDSASHPLTAPLPFAAMVACVIAGFLALDHFSNGNEQLLLGAATWAILIGSCASGREDRTRRCWWSSWRPAPRCSARRIGTTYRLEPAAFVPPGLGWVFWRDFGSAQSGSSATYPRLPLGVIGLVAAWGAARVGAARPDRRLGRDHRACSSTFCSRWEGHHLRRRLPDGRLPRDLRHFVGAWHWAATAPDTPLPWATRRTRIASSSTARSLWRLAAFDALRRLPRLPYSAIPAASSASERSQ